MFYRKQYSENNCLELISWHLEQAFSTILDNILNQFEESFSELRIHDIIALNHLESRVAKIE